ncbi:putative Lhr helicase/ uracil glycosylase [Frankia sp. AiPs1]|uniref:ATP-dependent helicase n=1 Tax=Frankia sp. AiPa1 TaxID=573492 RepID=UPI00202AEE3C|nr:ATP-dependent helicase [Frankia sp. AiPa1]MCL9758460.1 ATP-dependent helicase [Frankia sp. AiPa1]
MQDDSAGEDTAIEDTVGEDTVGEDTVGEDTVGEDTAGEDTAGEDTAIEDTVGEDTVGEDTAGEDTAADPLAPFSAPTREWFQAAFAAPTPAQRGAWEAIRGGGDTLVVAPTGSGKTLAAFLWSLDSLAQAQPPPERSRRCRVLYISPLKALAVDVQRNLRAPLAGIRAAAQRLGLPRPEIDVAIRSGDTPATERRGFAAHPPDVLITTPESLFLMLTSAARESLRGVRMVIIDEVHAVAGTKRGAHLAVSLERLDALLDEPAQRVGLSATVRPIEEVARFLGGARPVGVVRPPTAKTLELEVIMPVEDMTDLGEPLADADPDGSAAAARRASIWPAVEERVLDLILAHASTIVFVNSRRLAERLCARLNERHADRLSPDEDDPAGDAAASGAGGDPRDRFPAETMGAAGLARIDPTRPEVARAHHGSVSREQRRLIEEDLKAGRLPAVVATSSLELGIDMGAVDLVVQIGSPPSVAAGMQRVGRAGHQVGAPSVGVVLPRHRGDLLECAVVAERMRAGQIESLRYPRNPLDVLAQQIVAMTAMEDWTVEDLGALVRRTATFASLPASVLEGVLDMLAGRYPSDAFAELRPRIVWDRATGMLHGRPGGQRLAVTSGGTIPDRGMFGVFLVGEKSSRVGELDEEMVYESRVGDVVLLGSSSWRIEEITPDRVLVTPAPGRPGRLPFWHGDAPGRPAELGRQLGAFLRELGQLPSAAADARLRDAGLDAWAAANLLRYLEEQRAAVGHLSDDRTIVVERFRDELGDWRLAVHSPFGAPVNAPWALALGARLREQYGTEVQIMHTDDGIVARVPDAAQEPSAELAVFEPDEIDAIVRAEIGASALFASRFRECAGRALLLPRRTPGRRTPLWQQRQRSAQLLSVAATFTDFPIVLETMRECLQDVFDTPSLVGLMREIAGRSLRVVEVETPGPSPFAGALLFGYVAAFMYDGDAPLAERRAQVLSLDSSLLAELLGEADLRELVDPAVLARLSADLTRLSPDRHARDVEGVADLLRLVGDLTTEEALARGATPVWLAELEQARRILRVRIAGEERWVPVEDAGRLRDALGVALPLGVPDAFAVPVDDPLGDLLSRYARTHGPFDAAEPARRLGLGVAVVVTVLEALTARGRLVRGELHPERTGVQWCDAEVLRMLRRRSLAALRREIEPTPVRALGAFLPAWHGITGSGRRSARGVDGVLRAVEQLQGALIPASAWERLVLPARVPGYSPALLDELCSAGEVQWAGAGGLPGGDGWLTLVTADAAPLLLPVPDVDAAGGPLHGAILEALGDGAAMFFRALSDRVGSLDDSALATALWDLVWAGQITNDTLAPLRVVLGSGGSRGSGSGGIDGTPAGNGRRRTARPRPSRYGRPAMPRRTGPPTTAGRWSALPARDGDPTRRAHAQAEALLDRHGIVTRGAATAEHTPGGFAAVYRVLSAFEDAGRARRGYFIEGLGAAQFAVPGAVDRLRTIAAAQRDAAATPAWAPAAPAPSASDGVVLAATDPANPFGAALPWPVRPGPAPDAAGHRPGRKAGALVVLVDGELVLYVERGGRSLLTWSADEKITERAAEALARSVIDGALGTLSVEKADGGVITTSTVGAALTRAGFRPTPRGLRLRR